MDFIGEMELLALGSRLRRLSDRIMSSGAAIYRAQEVDFEPRWFPLFRLLADKGELTVGECARSLELTHAAISQTASKMTGRGLIEVVKDPKDERRRYLKLSDTGREMLPHLRELWGDIEHCIADAVDYSGIDILAAVEGLESAFAISSLSDRVTEHRRNRMLSTVQIVDFKKEFALDFKRLNLEWLEKYFTVEPIDEEVLSHPEHIIDDGGAILFATLEDEVVGCCALMFEDDQCELTKMAVTEKHRGRRIGSKLLEAALDRARSLNLSKVHLVTNSGLLPAVNLYRKFGFRVQHAGQNEKYERGDLMMEVAL